MKNIKVWVKDLSDDDKWEILLKLDAMEGFSKHEDFRKHKMKKVNFFAGTSRIYYGVERMSGNNKNRKAFDKCDYEEVFWYDLLDKQQMIVKIIV